MNDLFMEGFLAKVEASSVEFIPTWMRFGIEENVNEEDKEIKLTHLREKIVESLQMLLFIKIG